MTRFIHTADLHIDSPLKALSLSNSKLAESLLDASRQAFDKLISYAIAEKVSFILIAGDLFDGDSIDPNSAIFVRKNFLKLEEAGIDCYLVFGNHDLQNSLLTQGRMDWPKNVHVFSAESPETIRRSNESIAIHGQSYISRFCENNLVDKYPESLSGFFNIGILHTSLAAPSEGNRYAPATVDQLRGKLYDYWALGHIHKKEVYSESSPWIGYSGNIQGRDIGECGAKGFFVVEVDEGRMVSPPAFVETDRVRWLEAKWDLTGIDTHSDYEKICRERIRELESLLTDQTGIVRLHITGRTELCHQFCMPNSRKDYETELIGWLGGCSKKLVLDRILWKAELPPSKGLFMAGGIFEQLLKDIEQTQSMTERSFENEIQWLKGLNNRVGSFLIQSGYDINDPKQLKEWYTQAKNILMNRFGVHKDLEDSENK